MERSPCSSTPDPASPLLLPPPTALGHTEASPGCDAPPYEEWLAYAARAESRYQQAATGASSSHASPTSSSSPQQQAAVTAKLPWDLHILKSSQLDAHRLDGELTSMLHEQLSKVFSYFQPGQVASFEPELHAILMLLVFAMSVARGKATPGSQLLNLRYRNEWAMGSRQAKVTSRSGIEGPGPSTAQRLLFGLGYVALPYLWGRLGRLAAQIEWNDRMGVHNVAGGWGSSFLGTRAWSVLKGLEATYKVSAFVNLAVFLKRGVYRSLLERLTGMRLVYQQAVMTRVISFEYLNRQLVWQEVSELLLFLLPLLDVARVKRALLALLPRLPSPALLLAASGLQQQQQQGGGAPAAVVSSATPAGPAGTSPAGRSTATELGAPCPLCGTAQPLLPFQALPCRHVFCYYCLRANCEADAAFACPLDGARVDAMRRWGRRAVADKQG